jgi:hypothetical protein
LKRLRGSGTRIGRMMQKTAVRNTTNVHLKRLDEEKKKVKRKEKLFERTMPKGR